MLPRGFPMMPPPSDLRWFISANGGFGVQEPFNSHPRTVGDLLSANERACIYVPEFQRGYSWKKEHVETFWDDLRNFQIEGKKKNGPTKYFVGPIVTQSKDKTRTDLLDGQQRLATATILIAAIREATRHLSPPEFKFQEADDFRRDLQRDLIEKATGGFALEMGETDKDYFRETIQRDPPKHDTKVKTRSHQNINEARKILEAAVSAHIRDMAPHVALRELKELQQMVRSDLVMACIPVEQERDAFKIFETLNNRGLRLSPSDLLLNYLMRVSTAEERTKIRDCWTAMVEMMGVRDVHSFLRHLWICRVGDIKNEDLFTSIQRNIESGQLNGLEFAEVCQLECELYCDLCDADSEALGDAAQHIKNLVGGLGCKAALPLLLAVYYCFPLSLEDAVRWILIYVVRHSILAGQERSKMEALLFDLAHRVWTKSDDAAFKTGHRAILKQALREAAPSDQVIGQSLETIELTSEEARYVVRKIADHLQSSTGEVGSQIKKTNIEHIFPKNPSVEWENAESLRPYLWHIGNLTLLSKRLNKNIDNGGFPEKRKCFAEKTELKISQDVAAGYTEWTVEAIKERAKSLAKAANEVWNFDNPSRI